jgi:hypothetical protein
MLHKHYVQSFTEFLIMQKAWILEFYIYVVFLDEMESSNLHLIYAYTVEYQLLDCLQTLFLLICSWICFYVLVTHVVPGV